MLGVLERSLPVKIQASVLVTSVKSMAQVTSTLVLPYNLIERTYLWYSLEIWISIFLLLCISTYLLYEAWRGYEKHSNAIATK